MLLKKKEVDQEIAEEDISDADKHMAANHVRWIYFFRFSFQIKKKWGFFLYFSKYFTSEILNYIFFNVEKEIVVEYGKTQTTLHSL